MAYYPLASLAAFVESLLLRVGALIAKLIVCCTFQGSGCIGIHVLHLLLPFSLPALAFRLFLAPFLHTHALFSQF
jgi:hypothetical protein